MKCVFLRDFDLDSNWFWCCKKPDSYSIASEKQETNNDKFIQSKNVFPPFFNIKIGFFISNQEEEEEEEEENEDEDDSEEDGSPDKNNKKKANPVECQQQQVFFPTFAYVTTHFVSFL